MATHLNGFVAKGRQSTEEGTKRKIRQYYNFHVLSNLNGVFKLPDSETETVTDKNDCIELYEGVNTPAKPVFSKHCCKPMFSNEPFTYHKEKKKLFAFIT